MLDSLASHQRHQRHQRHHGAWGLAGRALASIALGALCLAIPEQALALFVPLFATFALVDGGVGLVGADARSWALLYIGAVGLATCGFCFFLSGEGGVAVVTAFGAWAVAVGILEMIAAGQVHKIDAAASLLALSGAAGVAIGAVAVAAPVTSAPALIGWIGAYAVLAGACRFVVAMLMPSATSDEDRIAAAALAPAI